MNNIYKTRLLVNNDTIFGVSLGGLAPVAATNTTRNACDITSSLEVISLDPKCHLSICIVTVSYSLQSFSEFFGTSLRKGTLSGCSPVRWRALHVE